VQRAGSITGKAGRRSGFMGGGACRLGDGFGVNAGARADRRR
jgi:hypothetical protein